MISAWIGPPTAETVTTAMLAGGAMIVVIVTRGTTTVTVPSEPTVVIALIGPTAIIAPTGWIALPIASIAWTGPTMISP